MKKGKTKKICVFIIISIIILGVVCARVQKNDGWFYDDRIDTLESFASLLVPKGVIS